MRVRPANTQTCSKHAKSLKRALDEHGVDIPLSAAQNLVGRMHGYRTWHEMSLAAKAPGLPSPCDEDVGDAERLLRRRHQVSVLTEACGLPVEIADDVLAWIAPTARKAVARSIRYLPVGSLEKDPQDGLHDLRERLTRSLALLPPVDERLLGGGVSKRIKFDVHDLMMATGLGEDEVGTATPRAWPIRDAGAVSALADSLRFAGEEGEEFEGRLRGVDPGDTAQILYAVGVDLDGPVGYLHARREVALDVRAGGHKVSYLFDLETVYLAPAFRGNRISYAFAALVRQVIEHELYEIARRAPSVLGPHETNVFVSTEIEQIPDNRLMRRMDVMFQTMHEGIEANFPDGEFDFIVDYDNVPMILAGML